MQSGTTPCFKAPQFGLTIWVDESGEQVVWMSRVDESGEQVVWMSRVDESGEQVVWMSRVDESGGQLGGG